MVKKINDRIKFLKKTKKKLLKEYPELSEDMQNVFAERNMAINIELGFLNSLLKVDVGGKFYCWSEDAGCDRCEHICDACKNYRDKQSKNSK